MILLLALNNLICKSQGGNLAEKSHWPAQHSKKSREIIVNPDVDGYT